MIKQRAFELRVWTVGVKCSCDDKDIINQLIQNIYNKARKENIIVDNNKHTIIYNVAFLQKFMYCVYF